MKTKKPAGTLLLALDPFESATDPSPSAVAELNAWAAGQGWKIQPVYIASPSTADISLGYVAPVAELEKKLESHARNLGFEIELPARVLVDDTSSRQGGVRRFLDFAEQAGTGAVALTSHGRSGIDRFLLGSFAESLLREAPWPVFFLTNAEGRKGEKPRTIFFATDFSPASRKVFDRFLAELELGGRRLVIFHSINFPTPYAPMGGTYIPDNYFSEQEAWAKKSAAEWAEIARGAGARVEAIVRTGGVNILTGREIVAAAKAENAELIVMATASGPLERALFGSVAFEIFRSRQVPVLVYGPKALPAALAGGRAS